MGFQILNLLLSSNDHLDFCSPSLEALNSLFVINVFYSSFFKADTESCLYLAIQLDCKAEVVCHAGEEVLQVVRLGKSFCYFNSMQISKYENHKCYSKVFLPAETHWGGTEVVSL